MVVMRTIVAVLVVSASLLTLTDAFTIVQSRLSSSSTSTNLVLAATSADSTSGTTSTNVFSLSLAKPLGMILEEVQEGVAAGVFVKEITDSGSASTHADVLLGCRVAAVQGQNVQVLDFDAVMEKIMDAPATVDLQFILEENAEEVAAAAAAAAVVDDDAFPLGTPVLIQVLQKGKDDELVSINGNVGDNLRQVLLDNGVEVYQGMKQKLGNCGGGGQCTFCAVDILDNKGWLERSDYEDQKLAKWPSARLACLNNIQGPATIRKTER